MTKITKVQQTTKNDLGKNIDHDTSNPTAKATANEKTQC